MVEQGRTHPNKVEHGRTEQRLLPIGAIEESDAAYLDAVDACELSPGMAAILRWMILDGRRDGRRKLVRVRPQREVATRLGVALSTVSQSLKRLTSSGLLSQVDGDWRLDTELLVEISEEAASRKQSVGPRIDPAEALDRLRVRARSGVFDLVRPCSTAFGSGSVEKRSTTPVPRSGSVPDPSGAAESPEQARTRPNVANSLLRTAPAWRRLQSHHFRGRDGGVRLDVPALIDAYRDAARAGLLGPLPPADQAQIADWAAENHASIREAKLLLLATAYDLAADGRIGSPVPCLAARVEGGSCRRISEEGRRFAVEALRPADLRERVMERDDAYV